MERILKSTKRSIKWHIKTNISIRSQEITKIIVDMQISFKKLPHIKKISKWQQQLWMLVAQGFQLKIAIENLTKNQVPSICCLWEMNSNGQCKHRFSGRWGRHFE